MGARYYDSGIGRFTQLDPSPSSIFSKNRYAYTNCNPVNATDPTGLFTMTPECWGLVFNLIGFLSMFIPVTGTSTLVGKIAYAIQMGINGTQGDFTGALLNSVANIASNFAVIPIGGQIIAIALSSPVLVYSIVSCWRSEM